MAEIPGKPTLKSIPKILERAKLSFVIALREAFKSSVTDKNLRYDDDQEVTKLKIFTAHPLTLEFYPSIVISTSGADVSFKYLSEDFVGSSDKDSLIFAGRSVFTLSITALTRSTLERERIMDHLLIFLKFLFRDRLHGLGVEYTRDIRIGAEDLEEVENVPVYSQTMDIPCYMEHEIKVDQSVLNEIGEICVDAAGTLEDGTEI